MRTKLIASFLFIFFWVQLQGYSTEKITFSENTFNFCSDKPIKCLSFLKSLTVDDIYILGSKKNNSIKALKNFHSYNNSLQLYFLKITIMHDNESLLKEHPGLSNLDSFFNEIKNSIPSTSHLAKVIPKNTSSYLFSFNNKFENQLNTVDLSKNYFPLDVNDYLGLGVRVRL